MLKKIVFGIVLAGISGVLIYGAINRTVLRAEIGAGTGAGSHVSGSRGNQERQLFQETQANQLGSNGKNSKGNGGLGRNPNVESLSGSFGTGLVQVEEVFTIEGSVETVGGDQLVVIDKAGNKTTIENRAWWFALEAGFAATNNDQVRLTGFYDAKVFEVITLENLTQGSLVQIRDEKGRPLWAGGVRG